MANPVLIGSIGSDASPNTYVIPSPTAFIPTAVTALFDGSASADSFLACLTFKSQDGLILARQFPETPINPFGSAEVSYAPF